LVSTADMTAPTESSSVPPWPPVARGAAPIRVSFSVLLRIRHNDRYVLFASLSRPNSYGPPGGAIKYFPAATGILEQFGFQQETRGLRVEPTGFDIRGLVPARSARDFLHWFDTGAYREDAVECLCRELDEEFHEVGLTTVDIDIRTWDFRPVRTVLEGPDVVPHRQFLQLRRFEIYDVAARDTAMLELIRSLAAAGVDPAFPGIVCADRAEIAHGRCGEALLGPHCAFLVGSRRFAPDLPAVR
jgi:SMODS-associated NUDIX domain